jgi:hypothetical protein
MYLLSHTCYVEWREMYNGFPSRAKYIWDWHAPGVLISIIRGFQKCVHTHTHTLRVTYDHRSYFFLTAVIRQKSVYVVLLIQLLTIQACKRDKTVVFLYCCEHGNEPLGSIKRVKILDRLPSSQEELCSMDELTHLVVLSFFK